MVTIYQESPFKVLVDGAALHLRNVVQGLVAKYGEEKAWRVLREAIEDWGGPAGGDVLVNGLDHLITTHRLKLQEPECIGCIHYDDEEQQCTKPTENGRTYETDRYNAVGCDAYEGME